MDYFNKVKANAEALWNKYMAVQSTGAKVGIAAGSLVAIYLIASVLPILLWIGVIVLCFFLFTPDRDTK